MYLIVCVVWIARLCHLLQEISLLLWRSPITLTHTLLALSLECQQTFVHIQILNEMDLTTGQTSFHAEIEREM